MAAQENETLRNAQKIFLDVAENFRNSLPAKEKELFQEFDDPVFMVRELQRHVKAYQTSHKLSIFCKNIERFAAAWAPFFDIVNIFMHSRPDLASLAWGAVRLVFLLGSNYTIFLEKLAAMFEKIGDSLPSYGEYYERTFRRWAKITATDKQRQAFDARSLRVAKALAYVYADIVQFCQEACRLFSTKKGGIRYKAAVIAELFWKPFDSRFMALLERIQLHQALFNREIQLEESKFIEMQFERQENDASTAKEAMEQIRNQLDELRDSNRDKETEIAVGFERFYRRLQEISDKLCTADKDFVLESKLLESRTSEVKAWINAPEYWKEFEKAQSKRAAHTCQWFISSPEYCAWKKSDCTDKAEQAPLAAPSRKPSDQILFITAKPGFGKTTLSSIIIEDLNPPSVTSSLSDQTGCTMFYHFVSEIPDSCSPSNAWKAVLAQLVHRYQNRTDVADVLSLLHGTNSTGQIQASDDEIMQSLSLLLSQFSGVTLVVDGIDECIDSAAFLIRLQDLCGKTCMKALLLGRPNIDLPRPFKKFTQLNLDQTYNRKDIAQYLRPEIESLQKESLISSELSLSKVVSTLVDRSHGMFLWASLMVRYLNCKALSPKERRDAIFHVDMIEGIEGLYCTILGTLSRSYTKQREKAKKVFSLMTVARRPLKVSELHFALAIQPGKVTDEENFIQNLKETLPIICGALVEVSNDETVSFIHSSFRDYLSHTGRQLGETTFLVDVGRVHLEAATTCLSYLLFDVPCGPLGGPERRADPLWISKVLFPFLEYSLFWTHHASAGIGLTKLPSETRSQDTYSQFLLLISKFLQQGLSISAWIEASWIFKTKPDLATLVKEMSSQDNICLQDALHNFPRIVTRINECAADLNCLNRQWGHLLVFDPSAIWSSSVTAFAKSQFFYETTDTAVSSLAPVAVLQSPGSMENEVGEHAILVQSKVSESGSILGIVLVSPSQVYVTGSSKFFAAAQPAEASPQLTRAQRQRFIEIASQGWKIKYQQRSILTEGLLLEIQYDLPDDEVSELLGESLASNHPDRFPFPIAFSNDLDRVIILRTLLTLITSGNSQGVNTQPDFKIQKLGQLYGASSGADHLRAAYSATFSPRANALAFVMGDPKRSQIEKRIVEIWCQNEHGSKDSDFLLKGSVTTSWLSEMSIVNNNSSLGFIFHPWLPLIAFSTWMNISIWWFKDEGPEFAASIIDRAGIPKTFLSTNLLRYSIWTWAPPLDEIDSEHSRVRRVGFSDGPTHKEAKRIENTIDITNFFSLFMSRYPATWNETSPSQSLSVFSENCGALDGAWSVERSHWTNAVVLHSRARDEDGQFLLAHLPRLHNNEQTFVSLLKFSENDRWVRLVWNQGPQESYSCQDPINPYLPCIISRKSETIEYQPGYKTLKRSVEGESRALAKKRLSGIWRDEEDGVKRRKMK